MTAQGSLQLVLYLALLVARGEAVGTLHDGRLRGAAHVAHAGLRLARARHLPRGRHRRAQRERLAALCRRRAPHERHRLRRRVPAAAPARRAALESAGVRGREPGLVVQHGRELRNQHELAGLRRRSDDELSHADARSRRPELPVGRERHGRARRADSRASRGARRTASATSTSISRAARSTSCCRCRSCSPSC